MYCDMTGGIPYSLTVPNVPTKDSIITKQFDEMMKKGDNQAKMDKGILVDETFEQIRKII